jgi:flagellar basal-body rod protein FlgG
MSSSLFHILNISRQDMLSRLLDLDTVSHNLANVNTAGYKRTRSNFQELLVAGAQEGNYLAATQVMTGQGTLRTTFNPLDLAISGDGYFAFLLPDGRTLYSRDGQLMLDTDNRLVNANGVPLVWDGQIPAGADDVQVQPDGVVQVRTGSTWSVAGHIPLSRFPNPSALEEQGENMWLSTPASGEAIAGTPGAQGFGMIASGAVEQSNVDLSLEMTRLMSLQRSFQLSVRAFQATDEMITGAIHMRRA